MTACARRMPCSCRRGDVLREKDDPLNVRDGPFREKAVRLPLQGRHLGFRKCPRRAQGWGPAEGPGPDTGRFSKNTSKIRPPREDFVCEATKAGHGAWRACARTGKER